MPVAIGALIFEAAGIPTIAGFTISASTFAIVGNIALAGAAQPASILLVDKREMES